MAGKSKVEMALSENELHSFCKKLADTPNLTLARLQQLAAELGIEVSLMGAKRFKDGAFGNYLARLNKARETAEKITAIGEVGTANTLAKGVANMLLQDVFDIVESGGEDLDLDALTKIISRLMSVDGRQKELEAKLKEYERRDAEYKRLEEDRKAAKDNLVKDLSIGGLSDDTLKTIEEKLKLL